MGGRLRSVCPSADGCLGGRLFLAVVNVGVRITGAWGVNVNVDVGNCGETSALSPALAETDRWEAGLARSWAW